MACTRCSRLAIIKLLARAIGAGTIYTTAAAAAFLLLMLLLTQQAGEPIACWLLLLLLHIWCRRQQCVP